MEGVDPRKNGSGHRESTAEDASRTEHEVSRDSHTSRQSINVKLPSASSDRHDGHSPDRLSDLYIHNLGHMTPDRFSASLDRHDLSQPQPPPASRQSQKTLSPSPTRSLRHGLRNQRELMRQVAASVIERTWIAYRDRRMFCLFKHAVCAAESSLSLGILRKVCPREAKFLDDKCLSIKVRFRFGGSEFPPLIYFKIFHSTDGKGLKYLSGRKMIKPASDAAEDSLRLMGNRLFYEQMLQDALRQKQCPVADEVDVTTLKDYMLYLSNLDETPAYMGGRENYWRKLTLDDLSRRTIFYDIVDYAYNNVMTPRLKDEIPLLVTRPVTQEIQLQHIRSISAPRIPPVPAPTPGRVRESGLNINNSELSSSRRSRKARLRASKMRKMYGLDKDVEREGDSGNVFSASAQNEDRYEADPDEYLEQEGSKLYEWTQELSFNDDIVATPRPVISTS
ncbi:putative uncharacterized protein CXorf58 [Gigantopelta aegis]|uniref:putative uncharacterized protein CXorf58 n=1 Tax=Gigantopelta aegis TaxID=1735272 RepID=UPI001B88A31C|nr:putative uncharacterized protein CXorf58 [Gigantopelta aegis]